MGAKAIERILVVRVNASEPSEQDKTPSKGFMKGRVPNSYTDKTVREALEYLMGKEPDGDKAEVLKTALQPTHPGSGVSYSYTISGKPVENLDMLVKDYVQEVPIKDLDVTADMLDVSIKVQYHQC